MSRRPPDIRVAGRRLARLVAAALAVQAPAVDTRADDRVAGASPTWVRGQVVEPDFGVAASRLVDLDDDGGEELLIVGRRGEVQTWQYTDGRAKQTGMLELPDARRCILALADVRGTGRPQLVVASPAGVVVYRTGPGAGLAATGEVLSSRARFQLRVGEPTFVSFVQDVNSDGRPDIVLPAGDSCELWLSDGDALRSAGRLSVRMKRGRTTTAAALSDRLEDSFTVPRLKTRDVNGDGRPDLLVEEGRQRHFHMQRDDGTFPPRPDVSVNLDIFRDTTSKASVRPGRTLAGPDRASYEITDLDGDGITDYVIAHRRKVWIFHGSRQGPQFTEPSVILKVADDVTLLLVLQLDDDEYPDLFLLKVQVPTVAAIAMGLMGSLEVEITALAYASVDGASFAPSPARRGELAVSLPPIVDILKNPEALLERVDNAAQKFDTGTTGDLDGDGRPDRLLVTADGRRVQYWRGHEDADAELDARELDDALRRFFFENTKRQWNLDEILELIGKLAELRALRITGDRPPDDLFHLDMPQGAVLRGMKTGDVDGDGRDEVIVEFTTTASEETTSFGVYEQRGG